MEKKYVCPCGLTCCDCMFYKQEIYETARKLKELVQESRLDTFLALCSNHKAWEAMGRHLDLDAASAEEKFGKKFDAFKDMEIFMHVLDALAAIQCKTTCQEADGCSAGGVTDQCQALKCIKSKNYEGCWQCTEFEACDKLAFLKMSYGHVINENLTTAKEKGIEAVTSHGDKYYAWQRK